MQKTVWLSYDLGVKGDYEGLYKWLDNVEAFECGDSLAYFSVEVPNGRNVPDFVAEELNANVSFGKSDRVYLIWRNDEDSRNKGRFIIGKRKASPWEGFGDRAQTQDDQ
ncbi:hypothetical protein [Paraburkholderia haematera]|uniref:Uncharacterized protein n=1 Tax=Paraburkholderia haematera TaxID=2793077 RepID=A0ABM8QBP1_9BURK|nr:hypothetical protein [Paraburkholderia haematera]CAE6688369.1 hypothetical protein R69888_00098 [Paraburkholderia haematera]